MTLKLNSLLTDAYTTIANIDYKLKDYDKTIKDCDMAISVNSKDHISYNLRALSYIHINDKKKACSDFTKAIELGSSSAFQNRKTFCK
ncbi:Tetratricopeptide repeat protein [compost metagenome]